MAGLHVANGWVEAQKGTITRNEIGLNLESGHLGQELISAEVFVFGNQSADFVRAEMPIPEPLGGIESSEE